MQKKNLTEKVLKKKFYNSHISYPNDLKFWEKLFRTSMNNFPPWKFFECQISPYIFCRQSYKNPNYGARQFVIKYL